MNRIYRLIWNQTLGALVPVSEITRGKGGSGACQRSPARHRLAPLSAALLLALGFSPGPAQAAQALSSLQPSTLTQSVTQAVVGRRRRSPCPPAVRWSAAPPRSARAATR